MGFQEVVDGARQAITVRRVYGQPYERDGVVIIPAARVSGGSGGGEGTAPDGQGQGSGGGFGLTARPVGAFVVKEGKVSWVPAVDVTRIALAGQIVAVVALLTLRAIVKYRNRSR